MKSIKHKYREKYAALFLAAYSFFVLLTVFHFHQVDIQSGKVHFIEDNVKDGFNFNDKQIDITHDDCYVAQFSSTILNLSFTNSKLFYLLKDEQELNIVQREKIFYSVAQPSNPLRAPPFSV